MALSGRDSFKAAFISRCIEEGLSPEAMLGKVKEAREKVALLGEALSKAVDVGHGAVSGLATYGIPLALAAPPIVGGLAGYGLARASDISDTDIADIKDREVIDELHRQSERLRREKAMRSLPSLARSGGHY